MWKQIGRTFSTSKAFLNASLVSGRSFLDKILGPSLTEELSHKLVAANRSDIGGDEEVSHRPAASSRGLKVSLNWEGM